MEFIAVEILQNWFRHYRFIAVPLSVIIVSVVNIILDRWERTRFVGSVRNYVMMSLVLADNICTSATEASPLTLRTSSVLAVFTDCFLWAFPSLIIMADVLNCVVYTEIALVLVPAYFFSSLLFCLLGSLIAEPITTWQRNHWHTDTCQQRCPLLVYAALALGLILKVFTFSRTFTYIILLVCLCIPHPLTPPGKRTMLLVLGVTLLACVCSEDIMLMMAEGVLTGIYVRSWPSVRDTLGQYAWFLYRCGFLFTIPGQGITYVIYIIVVPILAIYLKSTSRITRIIPHITIGVLLPETLQQAAPYLPTCISQIVPMLQTWCIFVLSEGNNTSVHHVKARYLPVKDPLKQSKSNAIDRILDCVVTNNFGVPYPTKYLSFLEGLEQVWGVTCKGEKMWIAGSVGEGMPWKVCGDLDYRKLLPHWPVVIPETVTQELHFIGPPRYHIAKGNPTHPAFITLKAQPDLVAKGVLNEDWVCPTDRYLKGGMALSGSLTTHGPALTTNNVLLPHPIEIQFDLVHCLHCPYWPPCASDFLTRTRPHGWPSQRLIGSIQQAGTLVVGVGHPQSKNKGKEWRWSFSVAERFLMHGMNKKMAACIYLLRAIKKSHWIPNISDETIFCSYFIKTSCMWVCEQADLSNTNIMVLCRMAIDWLSSSYHRNNLPHYFIPEQNLIGHLDRDQCKKVHRWLEEIRGDIWWHTIANMRMTRFELRTISDLLDGKFSKHESL